MKYRIIFFLFIFCLNSNSFAQTWDELSKDYGNFYVAKDYQNAEKIGNKMIVAAQKEFGETSVQFLTSLYNLSRLDLTNKRILKSIEKLQLVKSKIKNSYIADTSLYYYVLLDLGYCNNITGSYIMADSVFQELVNFIQIDDKVDIYFFFEAYKQYIANSLQIAERSQKGIETLNILSDQLIVLINNETTEQRINEFFNLLDDYIILLKQAYTNIGDVKSELKADKYYEKINFSKCSPSIKFKILRNRSNTQYELGFIGAGNLLVEEMLQILNEGKVFDINSIEYLLESSRCYSVLKKCDKSIMLLQKALTSNNVSSIYPTSSIYKELAQNYHLCLKDYNMAVKYYKKTKEELIRNNLFTMNELVDNHLGIANCYSSMGKYKESAEIIKQLINNKDIEQSNKELILLQYAANLKGAGINSAELLKINTELSEISKNKILELFPVLSNPEREQISNLRGVFIDLFSSEGLSSELANNLAYNNFLFRKNLLLQSSLATKKAISANTNLVKKFKILDSLKISASGYNENKSYLESKIEKLEQEIMRDFPTELIEFSSSKFTYSDVVKKLNNDECSIEYISIIDNNVKKYLALVATNRYENAVTLSLSDSNGLDSIYKLIDENYSSDNLSGRTFELNKHLYHMFWEPLEPYLKGIKTIYYSPIDELNNMSFSTFVTNLIDTTYLMDKYNLQSVMSTAAIITNKAPNINNVPQTIALFGGVQYNFKTQSAKNPELIVARSIRGVNQKDKRRDEVSELPFTKNEIDNVSGILQKANWSILKESDNKATENKIKELKSGKNPTILHFATHGFAFPDYISNSTSTNIFENSENPMQRSGLLFYGASDTWNGKRDTVLKYTGEDGVLTAEEVSNLDLTNTKLVVMSACQSGLGAIKGTEGVYGLKRAFKLAGVENMIVSLWPVPDKETMELMNLFYEELVKTKDINESFQKAQKTMRYKYPNDPWAWGGFVLVR